MSGHAHDLPDGIAARNLAGRGAIWNGLPLALLATVMIAALLGAFGGGKSPSVAAEGSAARLEITAPRTIRNGEFFEMRVAVTARRPVARAVLIVPASLWRDMTVNTMIPAPAEERSRGGAFRFDYGELKPGERLDIKIDGQINPPLFAGTRGNIALADGDRELARIPLDITVLP